MPWPLAWGVHVLTIDRKRNRDPRSASQCVTIEYPAGPLHLLLYMRHQRLGKNRATVFSPLAVANGKLQVIEVYILDPQPQSLDQT